ncbi:MAG: DUF456 family protein [Chthoniobacterales bacterium]
MEAVCWFGAIILMAVGLIGTVLPVVPGTTIIFIAALVHRVIVGEARSLGWWSMGVLAILLLLSYALESLAGYFGARRFGATKWGLLGAFVGAIVGLFLGFVGLLIGPVLGAIAGELLGGKRLVAAGRAGWGTLLGNLAGVIAKLFIGLIMIAIFVMNVPSPR